MSDTGVVDFTNPDANMYGCLPCPKCGSVYRTPYPNGNIRCGDCDFSEPITQDVGEEQEDT